MDSRILAGAGCFTALAALVYGSLSVTLSISKMPRANGYIWSWFKTLLTANGEWLFSRLAIEGSGSLIQPVEVFVERDEFISYPFVRRPHI